MSRTAWNKTEWTEEMILFIRENFNKKTNVQLAEDLGLKLTTVRTKLYELGLYKMKLEYWIPEQILFLKRNYHKIGDTEIAELFNKKYPKEKGWSKKHIEKKRRYLNLKRTPEMLKAIREDWTEKGLYKESNRKMWETRGARPLGSIVIWKGLKFIKTSIGYRHLRTFNYIVFIGEIPDRTNVIHKDNDQLNCNPENLMLISKEDHARRNRWNSYGKYPEDLKLQMRKVSKLKRIIKKKTHE
ncbi:HNH endonuclease [Chryseobacterium sp. SSA4.19]|uniref:HNH endonuclease signature motif containing protein n=1 Tax=Chryseobacterium sp. SSA4.19 TaxID=2919915 RepID=UPI001F4E7F7A|nr:HNH endonuclease signature motif containing protein [Chryseobacterium sp. SSA4.19]MCJ8153215.1 HNH endonuclease [Chryseobacterium sp. SSA4.19]